MATTLSLTGCGARVQWSFSNSEPWSDSTNSSNFNTSYSFSNGVGANQCDLIYVAQGTIAGAGTLSIDLAGSLVDMFGNALVFARIKMIYVELTTDTTSSGLTIGGDTNAFGNTAPVLFNAKTDTVRIANGGNLFIANPSSSGYPVTAATGDIFLLTNADGTNTATYRLMIAGASS